MTTNREWLYSLDVADLADWFDAEHAESPTSATMQHIGRVIEDTVKRGVYGDTESENEDSRDKIEADALNFANGFIRKHNGAISWNDELYQGIIKLLDRQAAIIREEDEAYCKECFTETYKRERKLGEAIDGLVVQVDELTTELDAAKQQISQFDAPKSAETSENPASKCEISDFDDSREKLEADVFACLQQAYITYPKVIELLDRQATITAEETSNTWEEYRDATQREITELQAQVYELTVDCDMLENERDNLAADLMRANNERDHYRSKFGKCLDYADAIHALMDDEGMA